MAGPSAGPAPAGSPTTLGRLDDFVYGLERTLVTVALLAMTAVVFFEVTARELISPESYVSALRFVWWKWSGGTGESGVDPANLGVWYSYLPVWLVVYGVLFYAVRSVRGRLAGKGLLRGGAAREHAYALAATVGCAMYGVLQSVLPSQVFYFAFVLLGVGIASIAALRPVAPGRRVIAVSPLLVLPSIIFWILYNRFLSPSDDDYFAGLAEGIELADPADDFRTAIALTALVGAALALIPAVRSAVRSALNGHKGEGGVSESDAGLYLFYLLSVAPLLAVLVTLAPADYGWATPTSTAMLIWVGFVGASMATKQRRHIAPEFTRKLIPEQHIPKLQAATALVAALFCAFLGLVSLIAIFGDTGSYTTDAIYEASQLPEWIATIAIPITLATMTARFIGHFLAHLGGYVAPPAGFDVAAGPVLADDKAAASAEGNGGGA